MDPVGPWSAYAASYNRLANAGTFQNAAPTELHHPMGGGVQGVPSTTSQLLAAHANSGLGNSSASPFNPPGFLSPPPVAYDSVFSPLFHQKAHYGIPPRPLKQVDSDPYNQPTNNNIYEQNNGQPIPWSQNNSQLPSPFGILPHESVATTASSAPQKAYDNYNSHFSTAPSSNQISSSPFTDPKKRPISPPKASLSSAAPFFQQMFTPPSEPSHNFKQNEHSAKNFSNGQQAFNVPSPPNNQNRVLPPPKLPYPPQRIEKPRAFTPKQIPQKPTKYFDTEKRSENDSQSSPISYSMMDAQRAFQSVKMRPQQYQNVNINININQHQSYRFPMTPESDYQRSKSTDSFGNSPTNADLNIGFPRRPSPLHPQPSPSIPPQQSPVYPAYNSPMACISSPSPVQQEPCYNKPHPEANTPLDPSRNGVSNSMAIRNDPRYDRPDYPLWDERNRRYSMPYEGQYSQPRPQYFSQSNIPDLNSCRGDPISLVKNLQQPQPDKPEKPEKVKPTKKRKKNSDKLAESNLPSRVPPPAHNSNNLNHQNGYLDTRWSANPGAPEKLCPASTPGGYSVTSSQSSITDNLLAQSATVGAQQQSDPYYSRFDGPQSQISHAPETPETPEVTRPQPRVIVPDIAEELKCLLSTDLSYERSMKPLAANSKYSFLSSFVRFLNGDKDPSPPPAKRKEKLKRRPPEAAPDVATRLPEFPSDPRDDPRYYPLPTSTDKRNFGSSDSDFGAESESPSQTIQVKSNASPTRSQKSKKSKGSNNKKKKKNEKKSNKKKKKAKKRNESPTFVITKRDRSRRKTKDSYRVSDDSMDDSRLQDAEGSDSNPPWKSDEKERLRRKARERSLYHVSEDSDDDRELRIPELHQSDDPSWSPQDGSDDSKRKRSRRIAKKRKSSRTSFKVEETSDEDNDSSEARRSKRRISISDSMKPSEKSVKKSPPQIICPAKMKGSKSNPFPFNIGEFVILKSDAILRHPHLWKVTEKAMLQKFLHFVEKGMSFYHNLRFFTGWSPDNSKVCEGVIVKVISSSRQDVVVELLMENLHELEDRDRIISERVFDETAGLLESFEIYVQTLFSQALDSNFLNEIYQEQDDYFLGSVRAIEGVVVDLEKRLLDAMDWPEEATLAIQSFSSYRGTQRGGRECHCGNPAVQVITLSGMTYNKETLELHLLSCPVTQEVLVCRTCLSLLEVLHSLSHFKQYIYALCEAKVTSRKQEDSEKDTTIILNEMLADDAWILQLFNKVRRDWGYAEVLIENLQGPSKTSDSLAHNAENIHSDDNILEGDSSEEDTSRNPLESDHETENDASLGRNVDSKEAIDVNSSENAQSVESSLGTLTSGGGNDELGRVPPGNVEYVESTGDAQPSCEKDSQSKADLPEDDPTEIDAQKDSPPENSSTEDASETNEDPLRTVDNILPESNSSGKKSVEGKAPAAFSKMKLVTTVQSNAIPEASRVDINSKSTSELRPSSEECVQNGAADVSKYTVRSRSSTSDAKSETPLGSPIIGNVSTGNRITFDECKINATVNSSIC